VKKLLMGIMLITAVGSKSYAISMEKSKSTPPSRVDTNLLIQDDRFVPWPWSGQRPFPNKMMEGTWLAQNGEFESYFSFKPVVADGVLSFEVKQIDVVTCKTVAYGIGVISKTGRTFTSDMDFLDLDQAYRLAIRSFDYGGPVKDISLSPIDGQVVVLSIQPEDRTKYVHMVISKVASDPKVALCRSRR
jgi:hypothetical protein